MSAQVHQIADARTGGGAEAPLRAHLQPPFSEEIEQAFLSVILSYNRHYDDVAGMLVPEAFYVPEHQVIWRHICHVIESGGDATPATIAQAVQRDPMSGDLDVHAYLSDVCSALVTVMNVRHYARTIRDYHIRRQLIGVGETLVMDAREIDDLDRTTEDIVHEVEGALLDVQKTGEAESRGISLAAAVRRQVGILEDIYKAPDDVRIGIQTGLRDLDAKLGGYRPSKLYIVAGRPAMGKSAFALDTVQRISAGIDGTILFFSLEMDAGEIADRSISSVSGVSSFDAHCGRIDDDAMRRIADSMGQFTDDKILIEDKPGLTVAAMERSIRRAARRGKVGAIVIDYLQLIRASAHARKYGNKVQEITEITTSLKEMAKRWEVPVIALSQLSRQVEGREDKRPVLSDLRDSGSIEQDADVVMFLYRPEYYLERSTPEQRPNEDDEKFAERRLLHDAALMRAKNILEVIIAKQRHGPTGTVELYCELSRMFFDNLERGHG